MIISEESDSDADVPIKQLDQTATAAIKQCRAQLKDLLQKTIRPRGMSASYVTQLPKHLTIAIPELAQQARQTRDAAADIRAHGKRKRSRR